jgi:DNA repair exonuclease SbcCD nuclease subunit
VSNASRPTLRLLHTSDVHVGEVPVVRLRGLIDFVDAANALGVDAALIAGDLFDSVRVTQDEIDATLQHLGRLAMPVLVTTGNHDALAAPSIHERVALRRAGPHVHFLDDPDGRHAVLPELRLSVWARAMVDHHPANDPLLGYRRHLDDHWQVVMAHGHYFAEGETPDRSSPVLARQIAALGCDYVALGHWHRFLDVSANGVAAYYSGSPSEHGGTYASANLVTLAEGAPVAVERVALPYGAPAVLP